MYNNLRTFKKSLGSIILTMFFGISFMLCSCNSNKYKTNNNSSEEILNGKTNSDENGNVFYVNRETAAGTCKECFDEMFDYFRVNDDLAIKSMIREGRMIILQEGEKLYLVEGEYTHGVFRLEGSTQKLWVVREHVTER